MDFIFRDWVTGLSPEIRDQPGYGDRMIGDVRQAERVVDLVSIAHGNPHDGTLGELNRLNFPRGAARGRKRSEAQYSKASGRVTKYRQIHGPLGG